MGEKYELISNRPWSHLKQYEIPGTNTYPGEPIFEYLNNPNTYPNFQKEWEDFKKIVLDLKKNNSKSISMLRYGDGDHFFLTKQGIGSASPGVRALGKPYSQIHNHHEFIEGTIKNDYIFTSLWNRDRRLWYTLFDRKVDFPLEYVYGMIANRWFFDNFRDKKIGLIGASEKLNVIEKLLKYNEYREYIGVEDFELIHFPQKFACDDIDTVEKFIGNQLINSTADIYLVGIGSAKLALLHRFKKYRNVSYIDVGCGIDALAGCLKVTRSYWYNWINFRLADYNYSNIDYMNYKHQNEIILK
jgi:hypothetical protein